MSGVYPPDLRDVQIAARHADPRTTMRYDRARNNLDRHPNYILAAYMASGTCPSLRLPRLVPAGGVRYFPNEGFAHAPIYGFTRILTRPPHLLIYPCPSLSIL